ncbi:MAG: replicative helicase loader DnaI [Clostridiales bacterium]|jgi:DNA replication protein DnaC|nr:replicative helicase loader DnaI [Clostridiales bacterium]
MKVGMTLGLSNIEYSKIMREYEKRQVNRKFILDNRKREVLLKIPKFKELEDELISEAIKTAKSAINSPSKDKSQDISESVLLIEDKKRSLLVANGFPEDYLVEKFICPHCKDTGYIRNKKCTCFKQAIVDMLYQQSNLKHTLHKENFSTFNFDLYSKQENNGQPSPRANMEALVNLSKDFINNFSSNFQNLLFYGNPGVGKTFLSNCIAKELLDRGNTVIYLTAYQLFESLADITFNRNYDTSDNNLYEYILNCDLLIIDDLGTELTNSFTTSQFFLCINERILKKKATIISTNLAIKQLASDYSERSFSRLYGNYQFLRVYGDDIRLQ